MWSCYESLEEFKSDRERNPLEALKKVLSSLRRPEGESSSEMLERLREEMVAEIRALA